MKIKNVIPLAVAVVFFAALDVQASYDPSTGRWFSRDPIAEPGTKVLQSTLRHNQFLSDNDSINAFMNAFNADDTDSSAIDMPLGLIDATHSPYLFVDNNPQGSIDSFGLDRRIVFGPWIHWHIVVDTWDPCCRYLGQVDIEFMPSCGWREFAALSFIGQITGVDGKVNISTYTGSGFVTGYKNTTCIQDKGLLAAAQAYKADPPRYYLDFYNCRDFAYELFNLQ